MNSIYKINISQNFSAIPLGRFPSDSDYNGETFREKWLLPALKKNKSIEIILDGTEGYGSSFLEEAFGGLVRVHNFSASDLLSRLSFTSLEDPTLIDEISDYINHAEILLKIKK
jgi:STAS-like domain of unknown function (DUF4325)